MTGLKKFDNCYIRYFAAIALQLLRKSRTSKIFSKTFSRHFFDCKPGILVATLSLLLAVTTSAYAIPPSFRTVATATTGQTGSITIQKPTTMLVGDVMIAVITILSPNNGLAITPPAGWTHIRQDIQNGEIAQDLFYKVATGSEPASYTFNKNQNLEAAGAIAAYWQVDTTNPINAHDGQYNSGSTPTAPSITTTVSGTTLVGIFGVKNGDSVNPPNGMIEHWRADNQTGHQGFDETFAGPGATGVRTSSSNESTTIGQLIALQPATSITPGSAGTVLFVTLNDGSYTAFEQLRVDKLESWGYTVLPIHQGATQAVYDATIPLADASYISANVNSSQFANKLTSSCIGVLFEEGRLTDDLGLSTTASQNASEDIINIVNTSHYITSPFKFGNYLLFIDTQPLQSINGTIAPGATVLGTESGVGLNEDLASLFVVDSGGTLSGGGTAQSRRVHLPWGTSQVDLTEITANGDQIMKRSVEWASQNNSCYTMQKRSFLPDGTALADGAQLAAGTEVKFLIYINNKGSAINDISVQDALDNTAFTYIANSIQIDNSLAACSGGICTTGEEKNIFDAVILAPSFTDDAPPVDSDGASYDNAGGIETINIGDQNVPSNGQVNVNGNSVWALLFSVTLN